MDKSELLRLLDRERDEQIISKARQIHAILEKEKQYTQIISSGVLDPILGQDDIVITIGSDLWPIYVDMPLDKPRFFALGDRLQETGWQRKNVTPNIGERYVSQHFMLGEEHEMQIWLSAQGAGVNCRIVRLEQGQEFRPGTYEWVCEGGAEEMEKQKEEE